MTSPPRSGPPPVSVPARKAERRLAAKARRSALLSRRAEAGRQVAAMGLAGLRPRPGEDAVIAGYVPQDAEFDVRPLLRRLEAHGHRIALPVVAGRGQPLIFRQWRQDEATVAGVMGIPTPPQTAPRLVPDIVLVPFLEADGAGYRLGYGGGYYDRTLAGLRAGGGVVAIGVGFAGQLVAEVPHDRHDARLDWLLTENGLVRTRRDLSGRPS